MTSKTDTITIICFLNNTINKAEISLRLVFPPPGGGDFRMQFFAKWIYKTKFAISSLELAPGLIFYGLTPPRLGRASRRHVQFTTSLTPCQHPLHIFGKFWDFRPILPQAHRMPYKPPFTLFCYTYPPERQKAHHGAGRGLYPPAGAMPPTPTYPPFVKRPHKSQLCPGARTQRPRQKSAKPV